MTEAMPVQPANIEAERALLGCIFLDNTSINIVSQTLRSEDFYLPKHRQIFQAMSQLSGEHEPIEIQTLSDCLNREGILDRVGGFEYLVGIMDDLFYVSSLDSYIRQVKQYSLLRSLISFGEDVKKRAFTLSEKPASILEAAEQQLLAINQNQFNEGLVRIKELLDDTVQRIVDLSKSQGKITGISTGFRELDLQLSGLQKSDLILLAARPSMGKTALGVNMGYNAARFRDAEGNHPYRVAIFSLEMSKYQLNQRLLSIASEIDLQKIISGDIQPEEWNQLMEGYSKLQDLPIYIDDTSSISIQELRSKCRRMKMEEGLDLIVIDYLQLMTVEDMRRNENRQQEISTISRGLKALAKEMDCPVLALSQLSRKTESREGQRPMMSDMRESGAIEQDADVVMLLYREDYYDQDTENQNITDVIVAKHRNGPTGTVQLYFRKELTKFGDLSYEDDPTA